LCNRRLVDEDEARRIKLGLLDPQSARAQLHQEIYSAACRVFFERDVMAFVEAPDRGRAGFQPFLGLERARISSSVKSGSAATDQAALAMRSSGERQWPCRAMPLRCPLSPAIDPAIAVEAPRPSTAPLPVCSRRLDKRDRPHPEVLRVSFAIAQLRMLSATRI